MEYVGYAPRDSYKKVVVRGDTGKREFVAFWLDDENHILAAMNVNVWDVVDALKPIIAEKQVVDPDKLADSSVDWPDVVVRDDEDDDDGIDDDENEDGTSDESDDGTTATTTSRLGRESDEVGRLRREGVAPRRAAASTRTSANSSPRVAP